MRMKKLITLVWMLTAFCGFSLATDTDTYTVVGDNSDIFGSIWEPTATVNDMVLGDDGLYRKTYTGIVFTTKTSILYKVVKNHAWTDNWGMDGESGNAYYNDIDPGTYDITFTFNPNATLAGSEYNVGCSLVARLYYVYSTNDFSTHTVGKLMDYDDGVHSVTVDATEGTSFVLIPSYHISASAISSWSHAVCPVSDRWYDLYFEHMSGSTALNNDKKWYVKEDAKYTIKYNGTTFTSDAQITDEIDNKVGWVTYSLGSTSDSYGFTVSGADAYYVSGTADGKATLESIPEGTKIRTREGILLKKTSDTFSITTTDSNDGALSRNMLVGIGRYTNYTIATGSDHDYILWAENDGSNAGFYPVSNSDTEANRTMPAHRAFLRIPAESRAFDFISLDTETAGINNLKLDAIANGSYYTLSGQRVVQPTKGLYIVNGKKVIIK